MTNRFQPAYFRLNNYCKYGDICPYRTIAPYAAPLLAEDCHLSIRSEILPLYSYVDQLLLRMRRQSSGDEFHSQRSRLHLHHGLLLALLVRELPADGTRKPFIRRQSCNILSPFALSSSLLFTFVLLPDLFCHTPVYVPCISRPRS